METLEKLSLIACRIAEHTPNDLRITVSHRTFRDRPYLIKNSGCLVEYDKNPLSLIVKSCKRLWIVPAPRNCIRTPRFIMSALRRKERGRRKTEHIPPDEQAIPLRQLRPRLRAQLRIGVCRYDTSRILVCCECPDDNPRNECRLSYAMPRGDRLTCYCG